MYYYNWSTIGGGVTVTVDRDWPIARFLLCTPAGIRPGDYISYHRLDNCLWSRSLNFSLGSISQLLAAEYGG